MGRLKARRRRIGKRYKGQHMLTDLTQWQWTAIQSVLVSSLSPRLLRKIAASPWSLRDYANALAYISFYRCRWESMPNVFPSVAAVYRFNRTLGDKRLFPVLRKLLGGDVPFGLEVHHKDVSTKKDRRADRRCCGPCPRCGAQGMQCYKTRRQGSRVVRYYGCKACGHKRVWLSVPGGKGWQGTFPSMPTVCG